MNFAKWALTTLSGGTYQTERHLAGRPNAPARSEVAIILGTAKASSPCRTARIFLFGLAMVLEAIVLARDPQPDQVEAAAARCSR